MIHAALAPAWAKTISWRGLLLFELRTVDRGGGGPREAGRLVGDRVAGIFQTEVGEMGRTVMISTFESAPSVAQAEQREGRFGAPDLPGRLEVLASAPFMRPWEAQELGRVWELAWYDYTAGSVAEAVAGFGEALAYREELYPVVGCWTVDAGPWVERIYVLVPYRDWDHRDELTAKLKGDATWPPRARVSATAAGNKLLIPAQTSALR